MDVYVIQVLSPKNSSRRSTGDLRLVDCEDQDVAEVTVSARAAVEALQEDAVRIRRRSREFCTRRGMNYLLASNQVPVEQLVTSYLRARGLVR